MLSCLQGLTGAVTIDTLGGDFPMLAGNVVAIALSALVCIVVSLIKPQNYDWALMKEIPMVEHDEAAYCEEGAVSGLCCATLCYTSDVFCSGQRSAQAASVTGVAAGEAAGMMAVAFPSSAARAGTCTPYAVLVVSHAASLAAITAALAQESNQGSSQKSNSPFADITLLCMACAVLPCRTPLLP
jgi:hypothetical protein